MLVETQFATSEIHMLLLQVEKMCKACVHKHQTLNKLVFTCDFCVEIHIFPLIVDLSTLYLFTFLPKIYFAIATHLPFPS